MRRNNFYTCIDIIETLRRTNGLNSTKIAQKANANTNKVVRYLEFLVEEQILGSRKPEKNESYRGSSDKIYFLRQEAYQFIRDLNKFRIKFDIDGLEKQLQEIG